MVIISPLIALMTDQVTNLNQSGISAVALNSSNEDNREQEQRAIRGEYSLVFMAPERLVNWIDNLKIMIENDVIAGIGIDEVHSVSEASHDFRPDYRRLSIIREQCPELPILAVTATAPERVKIDIVKQLKLRKVFVLQQSSNRPNVHYSVRSRTSYDKDLTDDLLPKDELCIIYCWRRVDTEKVAAHLLKRGYKAAAYHAGLSPEERNKVHHDFINERTMTVCATTAFGCGIDIGSIRTVIGYGLPKSIEALIQESGRCGRDGLPGRYILFYNKQDIACIHSMLAKDDDNQKRELFASVTKFLRIKTCYRVELLRYFGERVTAALCRGNCDNCCPPDDKASSSSSASSGGSTSNSGGIFAVRPVKKVSSARDSTEATLPASEQELIQALREWRSTKAEERRVAPYMIFPDRTLFDLVRIRPANLTLLQSVPGIGDSRVKSYGLSLVQRIVEECKKLQLSTTGKPLAQALGTPDVQSTKAKLAQFKCPPTLRPSPLLSMEEASLRVHDNNNAAAETATATATATTTTTTTASASNKSRKAKTGPSPSAIQTWEAIVTRRQPISQEAESRNLKSNTLLDHLVQCLDATNTEGDCYKAEQVPWDKLSIDKSVRNKVYAELDKYKIECPDRQLSFYPLVQQRLTLPPQQWTSMKLARWQYYATNGADPNAPPKKKVQTLDTFFVAEQNPFASASSASASAQPSVFLASTQSAVTTMPLPKQ